MAQVETIDYSGTCTQSSCAKSSYAVHIELEFIAKSASIRISIQMQKN